MNYGDAGAATSMHFTWSTPSATCTELRLAPKGSQDFSIVRGNSTAFDAPSQFIHVVKATGLKPDSEYTYSVGCTSGGSGAMSANYTFKTAPDSMTWQPRVAIFGDMGLANEVSLPILK